MCFLRGHRTLITKELVAKSERFAKMVPKRLVFFRVHRTFAGLIILARLRTYRKPQNLLAASQSIATWFHPISGYLLIQSSFLVGLTPTFSLPIILQFFYHVGSFCSPRIFARRWQTQNPPWRAPRKFCRRPPLNLRRSVFRKTQLGGVCHGIWQRNNGALNQAKSSQSCPYSFWESCQQITREFHCLAVISMGT